MELGILNIGHFDPDQQQETDIIRSLAAQVIAAEKNGFSRYWLGEHYTYNVAWRSPSILISHLCSLTENIRIGSAGVLALLHSAFNIAQDYALLENLFPNRIDIGFARGAAEPQTLAAMLRTKENLSASFYYKNTKDIIDMLRRDEDLDEAYSEITMRPQAIHVPNMWFLGDRFGAELSIKNKTKYCISLCHSKKDMALRLDLINRYKDQYYKQHNEEPKFAICAAGLCNNNEEEARKQVKTNPLQQFIHANVVGTPSNCYNQLQELAYYFHVDEVIYLDLHLHINHRMDTINSLCLNK